MTLRITQEHAELPFTGSVALYQEGTPVGSVRVIDFPPSAVLYISGSYGLVRPFDGGLVQLTGSPLVWDLRLGNAYIQATGACMMADPTGVIAGIERWLLVRQIPAGVANIGWGDHWWFEEGDSPVLGTGAYPVDLLRFVSDGVNMYGYVAARRLETTALTPDKVDGLALWLKADAIEGLSDGEPVATWPDSSGLGRNATQSDPAKRPLYKTAVANGLPAVRFDSTDDGMQTGLSLSALPFTVFVVYSYRSTTSAARRAVQGASNWLIGPRFLKHQYWNGAFIEGPATSQNVFVVAVARCASGDNNFRVNGASYGSNANDGVPGTVHLGRGGSTTEVLDGDIAEVIAYNRQLSVAETQSLEAYLGAKWGIA